MKADIFSMGDENSPIRAEGLRTEVLDILKNMKAVHGPVFVRCVEQLSNYQAALDLDNTLILKIFEEFLQDSALHSILEVRKELRNLQAASLATFVRQVADTMKAHAIPNFTDMADSSAEILRAADTVSRKAREYQEGIK